MTNDKGTPLHLGDAVKRFQNVVDEIIDPLGNVGVVAAVDVRGGQRYHFVSGHADLDRKQPVTLAHRYQIGSQSKTFVAIALLLLHRSGRVDLETSVRDLVDVPIDPRITVRHLLMNTSGLGEMTIGMPVARYDPRVSLAPRDLVSLALPQGQLFEPGSRFDYCNTGWVLAAMVIEKACGKPYGQMIDELILQPLGLKNTIFGGRAGSEGMMRGYLASAATNGLIDTSSHLSWAYGAGDGVSTVDDVLNFYGSLHRETSPIGVLLKDLIETTNKPSATPFFPLSIGTQYGLGVERRAWAGSEVWGHPGSTYSYVSGSWVDALRGVTVTTCVTRSIEVPVSPVAELCYPKGQLFSMALATAYALATA